MKYHVRHIAGNNYQIDLLPENKDEHSMIQKASAEYLENYYHEAVSQKLGPAASLLSIINDKLKPYSVIGEVEKAIGIGGGI